mmetsp:Transcript_39406/g.103158  ORF Transcript_39406/g.103158 Transcript_39406/m.103158 type:complete len:384 (-) Transcript_39406:67-1218(-)
MQRPKKKEAPRIQQYEGVNQEHSKDVSTYTYVAERVVGHGSFGVVYRARVVQTGDIVAIKKVFQDKRYKNRELQIMKEFRHPNIVCLKHAFYTSGERPDELFLNVVMEYMSDTLHRVIKFFNKLKQMMPLVYMRVYTYQMLRSLAYIHQLSICHRDIKPQNLLVDGQTHVLMLCDFGSAKRLIPGEDNVAYICSRYYRAPELIFGATDYTCTIDVWSVGCVVAELALGQPLFPGDNGVDQLVEIIKVLGTPTREELEAMNSKYVDFKFPDIAKHSWDKVFRSRAPDDFIEVVQGLLEYAPLKRMRPLEGCMHRFHDQLREAECMLPDNQPLPNQLFLPTKEELAQCSPDMKDKLFPAAEEEKERKRAQKRAQGLAQAKKALNL